MKKFLVTTVLALTATAMISEAIARPMGGRRSIGRQSQTVRQMPAPAPAPMTPMNRQAATPSPAAPVAGAAAGAAGARAATQQRPSMWKGLLGGALLGLGLGALFSHLGIGGAMASMLSTLLMLALLALAVMFIVRMFRRKDTPANAPFEGFNQPVPAGATPGVATPGVATPEIGSGLQQPYQPQSYQGTASGVSLSKGGTVAGAAAAHTPWGVPADFDTEAFLRHAKSSFIRMQAAWDKGDVADLREFTTPEVFAELKMQIQERGANADFTDVVSIDAQLLGIETSASDYLASVQFNGMIRTAPNAPAEPFAEVWNMEKPLSGNTGWVLAGIQQLA
jgi:predicted lipid-binding transport protein (Tim44 family)